MADQLHRVSSSNGSSQDLTCNDTQANVGVTATLHQSQELNQQILDNSDDCIKVLGLEGQILFMSRGGQVLLGIEDLTPFLNTSWVEFWQGADKSAAIEAIEEAIAGKVRSFFGYRPTLSGEPKWWDIKISPIRGADGQVERLLCISRDITERRQAEEALRESEAKYRKLFESIDEGFCICEMMFDGNDEPTDYRFLEVNAAFERLTGLEQASGKTIRELVPNHEAYWFEIYGRVVQTREPVRFEQQAIAMNRWFDVNAFCIGEPQSNQFAVLFTNISETKRIEAERQQAEVALRQSEEHYRTLFKSIDEGFCTVEVLFDAEGKPFDHRILQANPAFERQSGIANPEGKTASELAPGVEQYWNDFYAQVINTGESIRTEERSDALGRWFNVLVSRVGDAAMCQVAIVFTDISERKQAEEALRESENRLRLALESAELGTWDFNPITGVLRWDDSCKAAFGLPPEAEINYDVFLSGLHPDDRDRTEQLVQFALNPESNGEFDIEYRTIGGEDGVERWIAAKGKAFFNPAGIASRFIGTVLNITEKKRETAQREHLLQREQAARETAEQANRIKDEFLAVLSHELRSPLNPILGWSKLLQNGKLDAAKTHQALQTIERNAHLQLELIEDLLNVSRILQGKLTLNVSSLNLVSTIASAMETVRLAAEAKSIKVEANFEPDVGLVCGDSTRLQQVIWNLLSNAVKFTPQGGQVNIKLERIDSYAYITISDDGKGIAPEFLPYVFDYFRQADATTTRNFGGLGLGLAIVRHLVELHGGRVEVESPGEGQGATFTVRLPLMPTQAHALTNSQSSESSSDLNGIQVLVVDDESDSREFVAFVLEQAGANVLTATTASEALNLLRTTQPNVLLSDIGMPEKDGYMLIQQVRALPPEQGGQVSAIALSAYAGDFYQQQALQAGFQQHLSKPVDPDLLVRAIASLQ